MAGVGQDIKDDLIVGRVAILDVLKVSDWRYMNHFLEMEGCPIIQVGKKWMTRKSKLDHWLNTIMDSGPAMVQTAEAAQDTETAQI